MWLCADANHVFWADALSLVQTDGVDMALVARGQITDVYLLALAVAHGGRLATFDKSLATGAVRGGRIALELLS